MRASNPGDQVYVLDCTAHAIGDGRAGALWSINGDQLNVNLIRFDTDHGVAEHINSEVDVLGVVVSGSALLRLDDAQHELTAGMLFYVPRGRRRGLRVIDGPFVYISCHQRRAGLWPSPIMPAVNGA